jgi:hypothetical protein
MRRRDANFNPAPGNSLGYNDLKVIEVARDLTDYAKSVRGLVQAGLARSESQKYYTISGVSRRVFIGCLRLAIDPLFQDR